MKAKKKIQVHKSHWKLFSVSLEDKSKFDITDGSHYVGEISIINTENNFKDWNKHTWFQIQTTILLQLMSK